MVKIKNRILLFVGLCLMSLCSCLAMAQTLGTEDLNVINSKKVQAFVSYALD
jgi:lipoprotein